MVQTESLRQTADVQVGIPVSRSLTGGVVSRQFGMKSQSTTGRGTYVSQLGFLWVALVLSGGTVLAADGHWAFRRPICPDLPAVRNVQWCQNPIDRFILARLESEGLKPAPRADRNTLLRRLNLDLTGLPPSREDVAVFVPDRQPEILEHTVERLLASSHFGERWAVWWLDGARYADTNGYEVDRPRMIWAYRDWVIQAINDDMPFDQFTIEQLAGDMLSGATVQQRVATGFHRNSFMNEEGGHDWEQFRYESVVDRVHTTATVFMGLTLACAQCHDHKFDPFTQVEYYRFFALLNNADEPELDLTDPAILSRQSEIDSQIAHLEADRAGQFPLTGDPASESQNSNEEKLRSPAPEHRQEFLDHRFAKWIKREAESAVHWHLLRPHQAVSHNGATIRILDDSSLLVTGDRPELDTYEVICDTSLRQVTGFRLEAIPDARLPNHGPGRGSVISDGTFTVTEFDVQAQQGDSANEPRTLNFVRADATYHHGKRTADKAIDDNRLTSWHTNGGARQRHVAVFETDEPFVGNGQTRFRFSILQNFVHQQTLGRFRLYVTGDQKSLQASLRDPDIDAILLTSETDRSEQQTARLRRYFLSVADELADYNRNIDELRKIRPQLPTTLVMSQRSVPRVTHVHIRGEYRRPGDVVSAGVPGVLHPLEADTPPSRLTLARWLIDRRNPLTARVIVNQIWQQYFGRGLVDTPEDFGTQGALPSHPQLLDWLAVELMEQDWSLKAIHRLITRSATYQQTSRMSKELQDRDPENILLARGPRHQVSSEMVRDIILWTSGLLDTTIGGPGVFPAQPAGALSGFDGKAWITSDGGNRYRRSLYTFRRRSVPFAMLSLFDAPPGLTCTVQRRRSTTPLQALALLNDSLTIDASRTLARRILAKEGLQPDEQLILGFEMCTSRSPDTEELKLIREFHHLQQRHLSEQPDLAALLLATQLPADITPSPELAAWSVTARLLLNLDEVIVKR